MIELLESKARCCKSFNEEVLLNATARADAFEEAIDLAFEMGEPSTAYALKNKAAAIRKNS